MRNLKTLILMAIFFFSNSAKAQKENLTNRNIESKSKNLNLQIGANLGLIGISSFYSSGQNIFGDYDASTAFEFKELNEFGIFVLANFNDTYGAGFEMGYSTYFAKDDIVGNRFGFSGSFIGSRYISGFTAAPFIKIDNFRLGTNIMLPISESISTKKYEGSIFLNYDESILKEWQQTQLSLFIRYDQKIAELYKLPINIYSKLNYDLQDPFANSGNSADFKTVRFQFTIGVSTYFDILK